METASLKDLTVPDAKRLANALQADGLLIIAFKRGKIKGVSYGDNRTLCRQYGRALDGIIDRIESGEIPVE